MAAFRPKRQACERPLFRRDDAARLPVSKQATFGSAQVAKAFTDTMENHLSILQRKMDCVIMMCVQL
jgi:ketosteroid isomerase-like protein